MLCLEGHIAGAIREETFARSIKNCTARGVLRAMKDVGVDRNATLTFHTICCCLTLLVGFVFIDFWWRSELQAQNFSALPAALPGPHVSRSPSS